MKKWTMIKQTNEGQAKLWLNNQNGEYSIWCNKQEVMPEKFNCNDETQALKNLDEYEKLVNAEIMTLNDYLKLTNITLTNIEIDCLNTILSEGSFYEEAANYNEETKEYYVERKYGSFIGWEIFEHEVKGCRGALASLVKKNILTIVYDNIDGEDMAAYYIHFTPKFKNEGYHVLDLD